MLIALGVGCKDVAIHCGCKFVLFLDNLKIFVEILRAPFEQVKPQGHSEF